MSYLGRIAMRAAAPAPAAGLGAGSAKGHAHPSFRSESPLALADQRLNMPEFASVPEVGFGDALEGDDTNADEAGVAEARTSDGDRVLGPTTVTAPPRAAPVPAPAAFVHPADVASGLALPDVPSNGAQTVERLHERRVEVVSRVVTPPQPVVPVSNVASPFESTGDFQSPSALSASDEGAPTSAAVGRDPAGLPAALAAALSRARAWIEQPLATVEPRPAISPARADAPRSAPASTESDAIEPPALGLSIGSIHVEVVAPGPAHASPARDRAPQAMRRTASRDRQAWVEPRGFGWRQR